MSIRLREFGIQDYPATLALWQQYPDALGIGRSDARGEVEKKLSRDPDLFLVAEDDGRVVGTVIGGYDGRRGLIYHLAVDHGYRGRGLGRMLMEEVESRLAAKGCIRAYLLIKRENLGIIEFYEKLGWESIPVATMGKNL